MVLSTINLPCPTGPRIRQARLNLSFLYSPWLKCPADVRVPHTATILALVLVSLALSGCGAINEKLATGAGDFLP
jgi:hypothetical protein